MEPVGDGTFQVKCELIPGAAYNFVFFGVTSTNPPAGLSPNTIYYDAVPNKGSDYAFIMSTSPTYVENVGIVGYTNINGDARRYIIIPSWLPSGTTLYVYSNWASTPSAPNNFKARPGDKKVYLSWEHPYGYWGKFEQAKAIDVIAGGVYHIFRSTDPEGPYSLIVTLPGSTTSYTDTGLQNGRVYYYTIISSDCYRGKYNLAQGDVNLTTISPEEAPPPTPNLSWSTPNKPIPIRFYIKKIDWKKVMEKRFLVYLTPEYEKDIFSTSKKVPARITKTYLRKTFKDYYNDFLTLFRSLFEPQRTVRKKEPPIKKFSLIRTKS
jgi:hypothetical protein